VPGHEFGGYLAEDVPELGLERGALVAVEPNGACGHCEWRIEGYGNLCPNVEFIGAPPLGVARHAVDLAKPRLIEPVALLGAGPIGLLILQVLKVAGAGAVDVVEPLEHRRKAALELGARAVFASVADFVGGEGKGGRPLVVEATNSPLAFRDAVAAARIGGRVVLTGIPDGDVYTLPAADARRRGLKIKFVRRMGDDYARGIELVVSGRVDVKAVVTHQASLARAPDLFAALAESRPGYLKALLLPNG